MNDVLVLFREVYIKRIFFSLKTILTETCSSSVLYTRTNSLTAAQAVKSWILPE
jgi:hypothetical protein